MLTIDVIPGCARIHTPRVRAFIHTYIRTHTKDLAIERSLLAFSRPCMQLLAPVFFNTSAVSREALEPDRRVLVPSVVAGVTIIELMEPRALSADIPDARTHGLRRITRGERGQAIEREKQGIWYK